MRINRQSTTQTAKQIGIGAGVVSVVLMLGAAIFYLTGRAIVALYGVSTEGHEACEVAAIGLVALIFGAVAVGGVLGFGVMLKEIGAAALTFMRKHAHTRSAA